MNIIPETRRAR